MRWFNRGRLPIANPDDIARSLDPKRIDDRAIQLQAARLALAERTQRLEAREGFIVETTLSGHSEIDLMRRAAAMGFKVNLVFVGLAAADISSSRVALRVTRGGHDVPAEDVERRFGRILANLPNAIAVAERIIVFDNSGRRRRLLIVTETGRPARRAPTLPPWLLAAWPEIG